METHVPFSVQRINHICEIIKANSAFIEDEKLLFQEGFKFMHKSGTRKDYFFGTYLNPFSCLDYDEEPGKVYLWSECIGSDHPRLGLSIVYKHNGAEEDVSVDLLVSYNHFTISCWLPLSEHDKKNPIFMRELAKSPTPITETPCLHPTSSTVFKYRIRRNTSDKSILNALKKAEEAYDKFIPEDHSDEEFDRAKWLKDSSKEHFKWSESWKARHP